MTYHAANPGFVSPWPFDSASLLGAAKSAPVWAWFAFARAFGFKSVTQRESARAQSHASVSPGLQHVTGMYITPDKAPFEACMRCGSGKFHRWGAPRIRLKPIRCPRGGQVF